MARGLPGLGMVAAETPDLVQITGVVVQQHDATIKALQDWPPRSAVRPRARRICSSVRARCRVIRQGEDIPTAMCGRSLCNVLAASTVWTDDSASIFHGMVSSEFDSAGWDFVGRLASHARIENPARRLLKAFDAWCR